MTTTSSRYYPEVQKRAVRLVLEHEANYPSQWPAIQSIAAKIGCTAQTLTYYAFPDCHWIKLRTNNPLGRIMREIRRRTRVVGAFPDGQSCLNLAAARLRHIAATQWSTRKYMNMDPLQAAKTEAYGAVVA